MKKLIQISIPTPCHENWIIAAITLINFMSFGIYNVAAQSLNAPVQFHRLLHGSSQHGIQIIGPRIQEGIITNVDGGIPVPNVTLFNKRTLKKFQTDSNGIYHIEVALSDTVEITHEGYAFQSIHFNGNNLTYIILEKSKEN